MKKIAILLIVILFSSCSLVIDMRFYMEMDDLISFRKGEDYSNVIDKIFEIKDKYNEDAVNVLTEYEFESETKIYKVIKTYIHLSNHVKTETKMNIDDSRTRKTEREYRTRTEYYFVFENNKLIYGGFLFEMSRIKEKLFQDLSEHLRDIN